MFKIGFTRGFDKQFSKFDKKTQDKFLDKIFALKNGIINNNNVKHLTNHDPKYRLRIGDYRLFFSVKNDTIMFHEIKKRKEAY